MHPKLFTIFGFDVSTFGVMLAIAFLVGTWVTAVRLREEGYDPELATTLLLYVMVGGILGSKLYFAVDMALRTGAPFLSLLLDRAGITWYGGLIGGTLIGALGSRLHGVPVKVTADCTAVGGALSQAIGRVGCFLVGDDYGHATTLPWGVAFPEGQPPTPPGVRVHPTQVYEILWLVPVALFLWRRRRRSPFLFGEYIALNGLGRLVIEHWRVNPPLALGLTQPQWIGLCLIALGTGSWLYYRGHPARPAVA